MFSPGQIVLSKVKGYLAWPAMVLDEQLLPKRIVDIKPRKLRGKKGRPEPVATPLRFFADDTYMWADANDLSPLTNEAIEHTLEHKRVSRLLSYAYQVAKDPPAMEAFIKWGTSGVEPEGGAAEEEEEEEEEKPKVKKEKTTKPKAEPKSRKREAPRKAAKPEKKVKVEEVEEVEEEPEWVLESDYEDDFVTKSGAELHAAVAKYEPLCLEARIEIQNGLLEGEGDGEDVAAAASALDPVVRAKKAIPMLVIVKTNLGVVLRELLEDNGLAERGKEDEELAAVLDKAQGVVDVWGWSVGEVYEVPSIAAPDTTASPSGATPAASATPEPES